MKHRPDIDGLRAVAIIRGNLHAGFDILSGGFVGVEVFFVISGYLIRSIIVGELSANDFSIDQRRITRIVLALLLMMAFCAVVGGLILLPGEIREFGKSIVAAPLLSSNIHFSGNLRLLRPTS